MKSRKYCHQCNMKLLEIKQCDCDFDEFEALENFSELSAGIEPEDCSFRSTHLCCHLIKRICPCCCYRKPILYCTSYDYEANAATQFPHSDW